LGPPDEIVPGQCQAAWRLVPLVRVESRESVWVRVYPQALWFVPFLPESCRQQGYHKFMVTRECVAMAVGRWGILRLAGCVGRSEENILRRPIVLDEIHVDGGDAARGATQIGGETHALQEYFRQNDS